MSEAVATPLYGLDSPRPFQPTQNYFQLIGWAFIPGSNGGNHVRIVANGRTFLPAERIDRVDVAGAYPHELYATGCGFKFICYLPFGFYAAELEVSANGQDWLRLCSLAVPVSSHPMLGAVDFPPADDVITEPVRIQGWCFHPEFDVAQVVLQFGNVEVPCEYGLDRPDVAARFTDQPKAQRSGFITTENLPRGHGGVKVRVQTTCGRIYFVNSTHRVAIEHGWIPKPPPPSPVKDLSTSRWLQREPADVKRSSGPRRRGDRNILFALYGDFSSNSALHVAALANELIDQGYDCVVAVPNHKETVGALPHARFMAVEFDQLTDVPGFFKDGLAPLLVHAWTSRENVRVFCEALIEQFGSAVFVHLEDNEQDILSTRLGRPYSELLALPDGELDALVPDVLSHPRRAEKFLRQATGTTVIVDRLREHVPTSVPVHVVWPGADARYFRPQPRDDERRAALGISPTDVVLFYHGNTHSSNAAEVLSLYEAVVELNQRGVRAFLIRTGRDFPEFAGNDLPSIRSHLIHLGHVARAKHLPALMALADFFVQPGLPDAFNNYRFPSKLPEFFSIGRPVILPETNLGSLVRHGEHAWVLPRADARGIADAVQRLQRDPALCAKLSTGALAFAAEHFSWPRSAAALSAFYRSLTALATPASS